MRQNNNMNNYVDNSVLDELAVLIRMGANTSGKSQRKQIDLQYFKSLFKSDMINKIPTDNYYNLLEIALLNNRNDIVEYLLTFDGWDLNHQDYDGLTILQYVSQNRFFNFKIAMKLLFYDYVDFNLVDRWGNNPLQTSVSNFFSPNVVGQLKSEYYQWISALRKKGFVANALTINFAINVVKDPRIIDILIK